jgi:hypothetical protein
MTCSKDPCSADATGFAAFITSAATKKSVAWQWTFPSGAPARHLIVATKPFHDDKDVKADPLYAQIVERFLKGNIRPYLTSFTPTLRYDLLSRICPVLKTQSPGWKCKVPAKPEWRSAAPPGPHPSGRSSACHERIRGVQRYGGGAAPVASATAACATLRDSTSPVSVGLTEPTVTNSD